MKPKFKDFYPIILVNENTIQIGDEPNNAFEFQDDDGLLLALLPLLNGELNISEILELIPQFSLSLSDLKEIILDLDNIGLLDDNSKNIPNEFKEWEMKRYKSNINFFNIFSRLDNSKFSYQQKISNLKVLVLGMGGLGSNLLMQLSGLGVGHIKFLDYDKIEIKNLNRQILYSEKYIGKLKTNIGFKRLKDFNATLDYEKIDKKINSIKDLENIITKDLDFVFCAADTPPLLINSWVNEICVTKNIPYISGGVGLTCGSFYTIIPQKTACFECYYSSNLKNFKEVLDAYDNINIDYNAAILPNISIIASMIIMEFIRISLEVHSPISSGKKTIINFLTSEITFEEDWIKNPNCKICNNL